MFLLEPNLKSRLLINLSSSQRTTFHCYSDVKAPILELWSNLSPNKEWFALPFFQEAGGHYKVVVNLKGLAPKQSYEFTVRFKLREEEDWSWLGQLGQNGSLYLIDSSFTGEIHPPTFTSVPQLEFIFKQHSPQTDILLYHFKTQNKHADSCSFSLGFLPHAIHSFTAIIRKGSTWLTPVSDFDNFDSFVNQSEQWQLFLYQDREQGHIHLWLAINDAADCWFSPGYGNSVNFHRTEHHDAHLIIVSGQSHQSIQSLFKTALDYYQQLSPIKETPKRFLPTHLLEKVGFCTWNAFGQDVDIDRVMQGLKELKASRISVSYLLLDDGWQLISKERQLNGFDAIDQKFPGGLKRFVSTLKSKFPSLQHIGVWHTLWGYWNGINQDFAEASNYNWISYPSRQGNQIGILTNPDSFYNDFYSYLKEQGIDFVKVDNQGGFQDLVSLSNEEKLKLWNSYRASLIKHGDRFFDGYIIHCMSLTPTILFHPIFSKNQKALFRNSDDFFPDEKSSHSWHIYANIINSLLTSYYPIIGDWDMFQSSHPFAEYHAASRSISGGPVYISDSLSQHNSQLIYQLLGETRNAEYTLLRSLSPPQPTFHTVFRHPIGTGSLISMFNINEEQMNNKYQENNRISPFEYIIIACFNTTPEPQLAVIENSLLPTKKCASSVIGYVVSGPDKGECKLFAPQTDEMTCRVDGMGASMISISPMQSLGLLSVACLGLIDKLNGTKAIIYTKPIVEVRDGLFHYQCILSHRSEQCGIWLKSLDVKKAEFVLCTIRVDGQEIDDWSWNKETGLCIINMMSVPLTASVLEYFPLDIYLEKTDLQIV